MADLQPLVGIAGVEWFRLLILQLYFLQLSVELRAATAELCVSLGLAVLLDGSFRTAGGFVFCLARGFP